MPIVCQFISSKYRSTAYGFMNMFGILAGALITELLGKSSDQGNLGRDFALMAVVVLIALLMQIVFLKPKSIEYADI